MQVTDQQVKHIDLITNTIERLARNSFQLKAWTILIISAVFALAANMVDYRFFLIGLVPAISFWGLDGYYLWQERLFRKLFDKVRTGTHDDETDGPFSMNTTPYKGEVASWRRVLVSRTLLYFYLPIVVAIAVASTVQNVVD